MTRCGYAALIGRPNVGKSTLLNRMLGEKVAITSRKPQTTRHQLVGIHTDGEVQTLFVDTPGLHRAEKRALNRYMNRTANAAVRDVDVAVMLVDRTAWNHNDELAFEALERCPNHKIVVINKVDLLKDKATMLPVISSLAERCPGLEVVPVSALGGQQVDDLIRLIQSHMPESPFYFPVDQLTDRSERFLVSEMIREKLMRRLGQELPYELTIQIESFKREEDIVHIDAAILVEKVSQRGIVLGKGGQRIRDVGTDARVDMEKLLGTKVMLKLWVKVKSGWSDDERALRSLGYDDA
jgi:GTP-binding protein Era